MGRYRPSVGEGPLQQQNKRLEELSREGSEDMHMRGSPGTEQDPVTARLLRPEKLTHPNCTADVLKLFGLKSPFTLKNVEISKCFFT